MDELLSADDITAFERALAALCSEMPTVVAKNALDFLLWYRIRKATPSAAMRTVLLATIVRNRQMTDREVHGELLEYLLREILGVELTWDAEPTYESSGKGDPFFLPSRIIAAGLRSSRFINQIDKTQAARAACVSLNQRRFSES